MGFAISGQPSAIAENTTIDYELRVASVPIAWRSRIVRWVPGAGFVDLQEKGPYRTWWHEHSFEADGASTLMEDRVWYAPPFGVLGRLVNSLFIAPALRRIFQYRAEVIRLRFGAA
jgi:ligand-binding SRPBCC domain-containing protein